MMKSIIKSLLRRLGYEIRKMRPIASETTLYRPLYSPWLAEEFQRYYKTAASHTLLSIDRCYVLERLFRQTLPVSGEIFECGVYRGGTAALLAKLISETHSPKKLYLFDTFEGMPATDPEKDWHQEGDFSNTSLEEVRAYVNGGPNCLFRKGTIPETFAGLAGTTVSFAHIDLDIYKSIWDSVDFVWPRLSPGGVIVFDDYGFPTCQGARLAVDGFFQSKNSVPLCLQTGQAIVFKTPATT